MNESRWQCNCGRFIAASAIRSMDRRDTESYYGVATAFEYECAKCGVVKDFPHCIVYQYRCNTSGENASGK